VCVCVRACVRACPLLRPHGVLSLAACCCESCPVASSVWASHQVHFLLFFFVLFCFAFALAVVLINSSFGSFIFFRGFLMYLVYMICFCVAAMLYVNGYRTYKASDSDSFQTGDYVRFTLDVIVVLLNALITVRPAGV